MTVGYSKWNAGWLQWGSNHKFITNEGEKELAQMKKNRPDWDFMELAARVKTGEFKP